VAGDPIYSGGNLPTAEVTAKRGTAVSDSSSRPGGSGSSSTEQKPRIRSPRIIGATPNPYALTLMALLYPTETGNGAVPYPNPPYQTDTYDGDDDENGNRIIFRGMRSDVGGIFPLVGESARTLGVRRGTDIPINLDGWVLPNTGGMSVAPDSPLNLPRHRRPINFGGTGKDPVWGFNTANLPLGLRFIQDSPTHGLIAPSIPMTYNSYKSLLESTKLLWKKKN